LVKRPRREYLDHHQGGIRRNTQHKVRQKQDNDTFKLMFFYSFLLFLVGIVFIIYINQYVQISRLNFQIEKLKEQRDELKTKKAYLQLEISSLKSLERIEEIAKNELGMAEPAEINYIVMAEPEDNKSQDINLAKNTGKEIDATKKKSIKDRIFAWFNNISQVQAGTLDE
jgi:cell division protein FtsL